jgi:hypothetical protein
MPLNPPKSNEELKANNERITNIARQFERQSNELNGKRSIDASNFAKMRKNLFETAAQFKQEKEKRIQAEKTIVDQNKEIDSLQGQLQ